MISLRRIGQGTMWQMACQVSGTLAMAACSIFLLRVYGDDSVGVFTLSKLTPSLAGVLGALGVGTVCPYLIQRGKWAPRDLFGFMLTWVLLVGGLGGLLWLAFSCMINDVLFQSKVSPWIVALMAVMIPAVMLEHFLVSLLQGTKVMLCFAIATLIQLLFPAVSAAIGAWNSAGSLDVIALATIFGMGLSIFTMFAMVCLVVGVPGNPFQRPRRIVDTLFMGGKSYVGSIAMLANNRLDVLLVSPFVGVGAAGVYGIITKIAEFGRYFSIALNQYWLPHAATYIDEDAHRRTGRLVIMAWAGSAVVSLLLLIVSGWLLTEAGVPAGVAFIAFYVLLAGVLVQGGSGPIYAYCVAVGKPMQNSLAAGVGLVFTVILDLLLIPAHGILGAAIASSCAYSAYTAILLWFFIRAKNGRAISLERCDTAQQVQRKIVYMGGYGRSGSTLIEMLVADNPHVLGIGEASNLFDVFNNQPTAHCSCNARAQACPLWSTVWNRLERRGLCTFEVERWAARFESYFGLFYWMIAGPRRRRNYARYIRVLVVSICSGGPAELTHLVDSSKSTRRTAFRPFWLKRFGGADVVLIHVVRDVRGCIWSQVRGDNQKLERGETPHMPFATLRTTINWGLSNCYASLVGVILGESNYVRVRYEDFVKGPKASLADTQKIIGLDLSIQCERIDMGQLSPNTHQFSGNRMRFNKSIKLRSDEEWRACSRLPQRLLSIVNWPLLMIYGYPLRAFTKANSSIEKTTL